MRRYATCTAVTLICGLSISSPAAGQSKRIDALNRGFAKHVRALPAENSAAVAVILKSLENDYTGDDGESFVPDSLAVLYPRFRKALEAFDDERYADVVKLLKPLNGNDDPFLAANASYFHARALTERGLMEETETFLEPWLKADGPLIARTPYAAHLWFINAVCQFNNLRFEPADKSLKHLLAEYTDAPEPVRVGARQLALEIKRREIGSLGQVSELMTYAADRLKVSDSAERVRRRQEEAAKLLERLIKQAEQREKKQSGGGSAKPGGQKQGSPTKPAERSQLPSGAGEIGELRDPGRADPGELWGKLPPAERERILQSLRSRFPSRYRELVEQYFRSLAEEK